MKPTNHIRTIVKIEGTFCPTCRAARECAATSYEVRAHAFTFISDAYGFFQVPGDIQPVPTVLSNTQDVQVDSIPGPAKITVNSIDVVDTAMTQLDTINTGYRQTLSTFTTVINGITLVCHPNRRRSLTDDYA